MESCWHQESIYQRMIDAANKRPLLSTVQGRILKDLIDSIEYDTCLDIGCGTAQISELCHNYTGQDLHGIIKNVSEIMYPKNEYKMANLPIGIRYYDLVIMSAFIDIMEHPLWKLKEILKHCTKYVIIHRQELTQSPTKVTKNPSYGGWTWHSMINRKDFRKVTKDFKVIKRTSCLYTNWEAGGTSVLLKRK